MEVHLEHIGKRFQREWIFRAVTERFESGEMVAILGSNGSGKSTLLQILSGFLTPSEGRISWQAGHPIGVDELHRHISMATPYLSVYEEFTLRENILFFRQFKSIRGSLKVEEIAEIMQLSPALDKPVRQFSSGMKQRVKLGLAILADTPLLLLDEPSSHLDARAIGWYQDLLRAHHGGRTVFIASNKQQEETFLCTRTIAIEDHRPVTTPDGRASGGR